jgi:hypothetical protein
MPTLSRVLCLLVLFAAPFAGAQAQEALDIGTRLEPIVDRHLIDRLDGTELRLQTPRPAERVLAFDKPWEGRYCGYVTVFKDGDRYRMYYRGLPTAGKDGSEVECTCYAESTDGINWTKPNLGLFESDGNKDNNIILKGMAPFSHNFAPFKDTRPNVSPDTLYKAVAGTSETGLMAFASPDGLRWTRIQEAPIISEGAFDSQNVAFWSETEGVYACYYRTWSEGGYKGIRTVSRATSPDFIQWSEGTPMDFGGTPMEHLYTNQTHPYFRAPHIYAALAARFMPERRVVSEAEAAAFGGEARYSGDCSDTVFMTSRGGNVYDRTFMEGFVRPGIGAENWTSRTNYPAWGVVPAGEAEMSFYVQRHYGQPTHHLQRMVLRTDGFASVHAPYAGGEMLTKPLRFSGKELVINFATSAAGSVWVELQDADGKAISGYAREDCDEIIGDEIERVVKWKGNADLSALAGQPVRLRFVMKDADLYSLRFR